MQRAKSPVYLTLLTVLLAISIVAIDLVFGASHHRDVSFIKPTYIKELSALNWHVASLHKRETFTPDRLLESWLDPSIRNVYRDIDFDLQRYDSDDLLTFSTYHLVEKCNVEGVRHPFLLTIIEFEDEKMAWYIGNFAYVPGVFLLEPRVELMERLGCQRDV